MRTPPLDPASDPSAPSGRPPETSGWRLPDEQPLYVPTAAAPTVPAPGPEPVPQPWAQSEATAEPEGPEHVPPRPVFAPPFPPEAAQPAPEPSDPAPYQAPYQPTYQPAPEPSDQAPYQPTYQPAPEPAHRPTAVGAGAANLPAGPGDPFDDESRPKRGRGRMLVAMSTAVGVLALVGTAYVGARVVGWATGAGPQPEQALPSSTVAFAKIDLNPSAGQKIDAIRFVAKLPMSPDPLKNATESTDLRQAIFQAIQDGGGLSGLNYATDVEPWLGDRIGVGVLPPTAKAPTGRPVFALAVRDEQEATKRLAAIGTSVNGSCSLSGAFALCAKDAATVKGAIAAAAQHSLADNPDFANDMSTLGEDGILAMWSDLGAMNDVLAPATGAFGLGGVQGFSARPASARTSSATSSALSGRMAATLRFSGPNLEIAGRLSGMTTANAKPGGPTNVRALPADTVAAVGISGLGDQLQANWPEFLSGMTSTAGRSATASMIKRLEKELGISIPGGISSALGNELTLAYGGQRGGAPLVAIRTDANPKVLNRLLVSTGANRDLTKVQGPKGTVLATDKAYATTVAKGSGLGSVKAFQNAVPDAGSAQVVGYLDIAKVLKQKGLGMSAQDKKDLAAFSAFGFSVTNTESTSDFRLRLTTT